MDKENMVLLWFGSEMAPKGLCVESLVSNAAMFRSVALGK
jgi:hypothetical protein